MALKAARAVEVAEPAAREVPEPTTAVLMLEVGVGIPDVYGSAEPDEAPGKASAVALPLAPVAVAFIGLRTESITWMTPLEVKTLAVTTRALLM